VGDQKEELAWKEADFSNMVDALKDSVTKSYIIGFEAAMEQATIIHPRWIYLRWVHARRWLMER